MNKDLTNADHIECNSKNVLLFLQHLNTPKKQKTAEILSYSLAHLALAITSWYPCMYPKAWVSGRSSTSSVHPTLCSSIVSTAAVTDERSDSKCPPDGAAFVTKENSATINVGDSRMGIKPPPNGSASNTYTFTQT